MKNKSLHIASRNRLYPKSLIGYVMTFVFVSQVFAYVPVHLFTQNTGTSAVIEIQQTDYPLNQEIPFSGAENEAEMPLMDMDELIASASAINEFLPFFICTDMAYLAHVSLSLKNVSTPTPPPDFCI
ncbi:MAG: hypothetical protein JJU28_11815 [Cyclobacteriaceae bacterium]|nr:hypothetical protein [Cyclobacteriaceae bacterium]